MCVKLHFGDLNSGPCPSHPTSTYTCGVTITTRVGGDNNFINVSFTMYLHFILIRDKIGSSSQFIKRISIIYNFGRNSVS